MCKGLSRTKICNLPQAEFNTMAYYPTGLDRIYASQLSQVVVVKVGTADIFFI